MERRCLAKICNRVNWKARIFKTTFHPIRISWIFRREDSKHLGLMQKNLLTIPLLKRCNKQIHRVHYYRLASSIMNNLQEKVFLKKPLNKLMEVTWESFMIDCITREPSLTLWSNWRCAKTLCQKWNRGSFRLRLNKKATLEVWIWETECLRMEWTPTWWVALLLPMACSK